MRMALDRSANCRSHHAISSCLLLRATHTSTTAAACCIYSNISRAPHGLPSVCDALTVCGAPDLLQVWRAPVDAAAGGSRP